MDHPVDCPLVCSLSFESVESHRMTDPCFGRLITSAIMDDNDRLKLLEQLGERISDIEPLPREDFFTRTDTCVFQCLRRDSLGLTFWSATFSYALYYLHEQGLRDCVSAIDSLSIRELLFVGRNNIAQKQHSIIFHVTTLSSNTLRNAKCLGGQHNSPYCCQSLSVIKLSL